MSDTALRTRLSDWFAPRWSEAFGPSREATEVVALERLAKGQSSELLDVTVRRGHEIRSFIIRCQPRASQLFLRPDVLREAEVLKGLAASAAPAPRVWWTEADEDLLGVPFFVMEKVEGRAPLGKPSMHVEGLLTELDQPCRERLWADAMGGLVAVHAADWRRSHAFLAPADLSHGYLGAYLGQIDDWYRWTTRGRAFPITDAAVDHLRRHASEIDDNDPVLVWNDARVGNMLFRPDGRLAAVIDWEVSLIGPAGIDLGYWLMMDELHSDAIGVARLPGWPDEAETIRRYQALSGRDVDPVDYFVVLAALFIAITLIRAADIAVERGEFAADTRFGHDNTTTQMIARRLGLPVPPLSPDYATRRKLPLTAGRFG